MVLKIEVSKASLKSLYLKGAANMKHQITINNYVLGAMLKSTPVHKIIKKERIDKYHTIITYENLDKGEIFLCEKVLARKLKEVKEDE